ncbi:PBSX family phage terminase large subunit [Pinisolibacter sp.]|uniref:PBSX family phage terminase large subunit n=1 Tax=Pinisolibacter sp. TaxID=2172024 RepID=UPI002FDD77F1
MSYAALRRMASRLDAVRPQSAAMAGPTIDVATGGMLIPGSPGGRAIRVLFLPSRLHVDGGRVLTTAEMWSSLGIDAAWENPHEEGAARSAVAGGGRERLEESLRSADVVLPEAARPLFDVGEWRHVALWGGRCGSKSTSAGVATLLLARGRRLRIICARQFMANIGASVRTLLVDWIDRLGLEDEFEVMEQTITHGHTGSRISFLGLDRSPDSAKSLEGADICWIEEAASVTAAALRKLSHSIRRPGACLWYTLNPEDESDPVDAALLSTTNPPPRSVAKRVSYTENPYFFGGGLVDSLVHEMGGGDVAMARHTWLGEHLTLTEARIYPSVVAGMPPDDAIGADAVPVAGLDFSRGGTDPHALVKAVVDVERRTIFVTEELVTHAPTADLVAAVAGLVGSGRLLTDHEPERIEDLRRARIDAGGARKSAGSVMRGIFWLRGFTIYVSRACPSTLRELIGYQWQRDRRTDRILARPRDGDDHTCDALRYAVSDLIDGGGAGGAIRFRIGW